MKKLNSISEDRARGNVAGLRRRLDRILEGRAGSVRGASFHESAGELSLELALILYALEEDDEQVLALLRQAATHLAPALALREPPDPDDDRSPWQAQQWIDVVACWGDAAAVESLKDLRPWQYRYPVDRDEEALALYLETLIQRLGGARVDVTALQTVVRACDEGNATKEDRLLLRPVVAGLLAVEAGDADGWNYSLAQVLSTHAEEARQGELRLLPDGFLCFDALLLAKLGLDRNLKLRAKSPYMPVKFLGADGTA